MLRAVGLGLIGIAAALVVVHAARYAATALLPARILGYAAGLAPLLYFAALAGVAAGAFVVLQRVMPRPGAAKPVLTTAAAPRVASKGPDLQALLETSFAYPELAQAEDGRCSAPASSSTARGLPARVPAPVCTAPATFSWDLE